MINNVDTNEKKLNVKKLIIAIIIFLIIAVVTTLCILYFKLPAVRIFFDKYLFRKNVVENTLPYISTESTNIYSFNNNLLELNENILTFYNKHAVIESSLDIKITHPIVHTCGNYFVIAEKNGQKVYLISDRNIIWEKDIDGSISDVYVNRNGYVAISNSRTSNQISVDLFSNDGTELFKRTYLSDTFIIDFSISSDSKFLAIAEANLSGAVIQSSIKIIDIAKAVAKDSDAIIYQYDVPSNNLIVNIDYTKNNILCCIYDNNISIIKDNNVQDVTSFDSSNILFADINDRIIQIEKKNSNVFNPSFELQIINTETLEKETYTLEHEPKSIKVFGNTIAINFGTEALFINNGAWLVKQYTSYQEIQDIVLSNNLGAIIFKNKVELISL